MWQVHIIEYCSAFRRKNLLFSRLVMCYNPNAVGKLRQEDDLEFLINLGLQSETLS